MLKDTLFTEENTADDLVLAQALLAERSPEDIAAALARLYRARLPSPEDILDPGQASRSRDDRGRDRERSPRGDDRAAGPRAKPGKSSPRHVMAEGSVWFRAAIGRKKNAEARWLLPMICRRGGIDKNDIGAIRIMDTTTEFEISERGRGILRRHDPASRQGRQHPHRGAGRGAAGPGAFGETILSAAARSRHRRARPASARWPASRERDQSHTASRRAKAGPDLRGSRVSTRKRNTRTSLPTPGPHGAGKPAFGKKKKKKFRAPA